MELSLQYTRLDNLLKAPRNPKKHDIEFINRLMDNYGYTEPVLVDERTGRLVAGHGRLETLFEKMNRGDDPPDFIQVDEHDGMWLIPVVRGWSTKSDEDAEGYVVGTNQAVMNGGWDEAMLAELLADAESSETLGYTGYDEDSLKNLLNSIEEDSENGEDFSLDSENEDEAITDEEDAELFAKQKGALVQRFLAPPFSVLNTMSGYWQKRKAMWNSLGIESEVGRDEGLLGSNFAITSLMKHDAKAGGGKASNVSTSIFDPVLCEITYRWFCPDGGTVLDPFAGGSVRGVVCGLTGREYTGIDLSEKQVNSNREQWDVIGERFREEGDSPAAKVESTAPDYGTEDITPVERHAGYLVKREDLFRIGNATGAKARAAYLALKDGAPGALSAGSRISPQLERIAEVAAHLDIPARLHTGAGKTTPELETARAAGAEVLQHKPGRLSVIRARLREDAEENPDWVLFPYGMETDGAIEGTARQAAALPFDEFDRIVVPVGSGTSLSGILAGLDEAGVDVPILGVKVGGDPTEILNRRAPGWEERVTLVDAELAYEETPDNTYLDDLALDPHYESKCLPFLEAGDLLWVVGIRTSAAQEGPTAIEGAASLPPVEAADPRWYIGDSRDVVPELEPDLPYDLMFTCPPYYDLEVYSSDENDLSNFDDYEDFMGAYTKILGSCYEQLEDNAFAVIVVGDVRDKKGIYRGLVPDTIKAMQSVGFKYYNEGIVLNALGSAPVRTAQFVSGRKMVKVHQNYLVFVKGDPKKATERCGDVTLDVEMAVDQQEAVSGAE